MAVGKYPHTHCTKSGIAALPTSQIRHRVNVLVDISSPLEATAT